MANWSFKVIEIGKPGLEKISIVYELFKNGDSYIRDEINLPTSLFVGKTEAERKIIIDEEIQKKNQLFLITDLIHTELQSLINLAGDLRISPETEQRKKELFTEEVKKIYSQLFSKTIMATMDIREL